MGNKSVPEVRFNGFSGEWEERKLKDVANFIRGSFPQPYTNPDWYDEENGKPFVQVADIGFNLKLNDNTKLHISKIAEPKSRFVEKGTVVVALQGSIEKSIGRVAITQYPAFFDRTILIFKTYKIDIDKQYFAQVVQQLFKREKEKAWGATISTITKGALNDFIIGIPKIEEQRRIGSFLQQLDDTIALHQQELDNLKQTKRGFLQKMFPKEGESVPEVRFSGFTEEWEERKLNTVFKDFIVPMRDKPKEFSGTVPWTRIEDIEGKYINGTTSGQYVSKETIKSMNLKIIPKGSLIVSSSATFGVVAIVNNDLVTNQTFIGLVPNTNYNIDYLYAFFKSSNIRKKMKRESAGSTIFYISRKQFEEMVGYFPVLEEQEKIGQLFKQLDNTIELHQQELDVLKATKKAFLQKMFV